MIFRHFIQIEVRIYQILRDVSIFVSDGRVKIPQYIVYVFVLFFIPEPYLVLPYLT